MRSRRRHHSSRTILPLVLLVSALGLILLPTRWTGQLMSLVQVLVPFQDALHRAAIPAHRSPVSSASPAQPAQEEALRRENEALRHQAASLALRVAELESQVEILSATRLWDVDGHHLGSQGKLVPARVVASDLLAWRDSRLVDAGSLQGIRPGSAVASQFFSINRGQEEGIQQGMAVLLAEVLVGTVQRTGTHTARVQLLSDVATQTKVRIGRLTREGVTTVDHAFWLVGRGNGVMQIRDVDRREIQAGRIAVGDIVLSDSRRLPASMTIGRITAITPDLHNPLFAILTVRSEVDLSSLEKVYVFVPDSETQP